MAHSRRYITNEQGERIGVLLDLDEYQQLTSISQTDPELLTGLSVAELQALAQSTLALVEQSRLVDLLASNADTTLSEAEEDELERLLQHVDQLTILKTRARYTLAHQTGLLPCAVKSASASLSVVHTVRQSRHSQWRFLKSSTSSQSDGRDVDALV